HHLNVDTPLSFAVKAEDSQLRYLPWYLWELFEDYPHVEPALAFSKYEAERIGKSQRDNVRILVVIGDSTGINTEADKKIFQEFLGDAQIHILDQPSRQKLDTFIRDEQGWDILAFLGHSGSGKIKINATESLSLSELTNALRFAIQRGLQLAIFNSCDGLGLVQDLRDLYLPHTIVMREPVPDKVAQEFIKNFLPAFKDGKSLSMAVREARENLHPWENNYPCATWLPVLCQNPAVESINWVHLGGKPACPYRGLFAFREEDADIFFGREAVSEELYTLLPQSEEETRKLFLNNLLNGVSDAKSFTLVLTLRADFFHHAIKHHQFAKALNNTNCNYSLAGMEREELQRAIRIPAEKRGVKLEPGLLELLLDDVGEKAENLPLLEFALKQLWTKQEYGLLTRNSYQEIGGLQQSLARHAEDIYT
ncbi:MAG: CHAT domain-containing protein, partial [Cyanobacteria bacterium J06636_27]